jgi:carbon monoxide dehydrogenase subunit G
VRTTFPVDASPAAWASLGDPAVLAAVLPGGRSVTASGDGDGSLQVVADVSVASVHGLWSGTVVRVDADAVRVAGSGAPGTVDLVVRANPSRSTLTVEGTVHGPLATVGSAVLAASIRRVADDLLSAAAAPVSPRAAEPMSSGGTAAPAGPDRAASGGRRVPARIAAAAGVVVVVVLGRRRRTRRRSG